MKYWYWLKLWFPLFVVGVLFRILSPIACLFIRQEFVTTYVKRLGKKTGLLRDRLVWTWFDTFDNPTDEYWYGMYGDTAHERQSDYNKDPLLRYWYRILWLQRNSAYTFNYQFFGISKDSPLAWQYKKDIPLGFGLYNSINIGWKAHRGFDRLMFAGRLIGIRKTKKKD